MKSASRASPLGWVGCGLFGALALTAILAPWLAPYDPAARSGKPFSAPGAGHLLGTNDMGQDILSGLIYGTRISLMVGVAAAVIATAVGTFVGLTAGYSGGWLDALLMRFVDVMLSLPFLPLVIVIGVFFGGGVGTQIAVISAVLWAIPARELRPQILSARRRANVEAASVMGAGSWYILRRHLIPLVAPLLAPQLVRAANVAILTESSLSFLGLGQTGPPSWGTILYYAQSRGALLTDAWRWWVLPPGLGIALTVTALALMGYALEERSQPKLHRQGRQKRVLPRGVPSDISTDHVLEAKSITVGYEREGTLSLALAGVTLRVEKGEAVGLVGVSGSGKTTLVGAAFGSIRFPARLISGSISLVGQDLASVSKAKLRELRGRDVALIPQNAMGALNPVVRVGKQIAEAITAHDDCSKADAARRAQSLLELVGIPGSRESAFPHELSGGMRQRVVLAMAMAHRPALLIADEPTTGLDPVVRKEFLDLLVRLRIDFGMAILLISHDLGAVLGLVDRLVVIDAGEVIEEGPVAQVAADPAHPVTQRLLQARLQTSAASCAPAQFPGSDRVILRLVEVSKAFGRGPGAVLAADGLSLEVREREALGLVGRSGAGKSTLARLICGLESPDRGMVRLDGSDPAKRQFSKASRLHMVFQDPYEALPPAMRVEDIVAEPLDIRSIGSGVERRRRVNEALSDVSLDPSLVGRRFPHELSGGERQRVALARAVVSRPALVVADEPAAMLDSALAAELVDLIAHLRSRYGMSWILITHELGLAARVCDRLVVLADGRIVDEGPTERVLLSPACPQSEVLVRAAQEVVNV